MSFLTMGISCFVFLQVVNNSDNRKSLKLADFGLATEVKSPMFLVCGTPTYVAPEILDESGYVINYFLIIRYLGVNHHITARTFLDFFLGFSD